MLTVIAKPCNEGEEIVPATRVYFRNNIVGAILENGDVHEYTQPGAYFVYNSSGITVAHYHIYRPVGDPADIE